MTSDRAPPKLDYEALVQEALTEPGKIHAAYSVFHDFSFGNQLLAMMQLTQIEPIASYNHWKELGRQVKKGAKGIALMMPVSKKTENDKGDKSRASFFIMRRYWFPLSATEGEDYTPKAIPEFSLERAAEALGVTIEPFKSVNGNTQGYVRTDEKIIAVNPLAYDSLKTGVHELAHVALHPRSLDIPKNLKEIEAELTSYLMMSALGHTENLEYSRGYIAAWMSNDAVPKIRFGEVFKTVDSILKAGRKIDVEPTPERPIANQSRPLCELSA